MNATDHAIKLNVRNMYFIKMMSRRVTQSMTLMTDPWQGWAEPGVWMDTNTKLNLLHTNTLTEILTSRI